MEVKTNGLNKESLAEKLTVGAKIKIGPHYAETYGYEEGEILELVEGVFYYDNGLYTATETAPAIWDPISDEFDSIFHLFGNDFEHSEDCVIL